MMSVYMRSLDFEANQNSKDFASFNRSSMKDLPMGPTVKDGALRKYVRVVSDPDMSEDDELKKLLNIKISIPSLSVEPLSGKEVHTRIHEKTDEVISRYLPCVDFLVNCQQSLRDFKGYRPLLSSQLFNNHLASLPERFLFQNLCIMPSDQLEIAYNGIQNLVVDAKEVEQSGGCDGMKNAFLGGMRDGESWGLRKWMSRNGGGLKICNDLELILEALRKLPKDDATTKLLAAKIRPKAKQVYDKLKADIPNAYQEVCNAHPYLPFFHRLESVLKGLKGFDPDKDDIICIDDESSVKENSTHDCSKDNIHLKKEIINLGMEVDSRFSTSHGQAYLEVD